MAEVQDTERPLVIVAEDEAMLRIVVVQNLEDCGFTVLEASDGLQALEHAKAHSGCSLLISDVRMPNMDGYSLAENVLQLDPRPTVLLLTGYADPLPPSLRMRVTLLKKPVSMEELCERAKTLCGQLNKTRH
jgi:CheY-like chemotaxis protein